jgi:outer membrane protein TolC
MRYFVLFVFLSLFVNVAFALDITLDDAIKVALKNNHHIAIAKTKVKKAECDLSETKKIFSPNISLHAGRNLLSDKEIVGISVSQDLDRLLGFNSNQKKKAKLDVEISQKELAVIEQEIIRQVANAYYDIKAQEDLIKLKQDILTSYEKNLEIITTQFDAGKENLETLLSSQKEVAQAKYELEKSKRDLRKSALVFYQLLGQQNINEEDTK